MLEPIQETFKKLSKMKAQTSMRIIYLYGGGLAILTILMVISWGVNWYNSGVPDLNSLISIFKEYTAPAVVAAFTFVSVFCVDKNNDGRPDAAELQSKKPKDPPKIQFPSGPKKDKKEDSHD